MDSGNCYTVNDNIHGHIQLPKFLFNFIDTPQYQRLRELHQLGCTFMVFPGARHTRFEHSVGVGYLAGEMLSNLMQRQPELEITHRELTLVQIAGLCHDLGHGPFSHAFEGWVRTLPGRSDFHHETMSVKLFEYMIDENGIDLEKEDIQFVSELISGVPTGLRKSERRFLFDIVSNSRNGVDVDKFDYLVRDAYHLRITSFDPERLLLHCRVIDDEICFNSKSCFPLYDMFHSRFSLWKQVYCHSVTKAIEYMICDMYESVDDVLNISGAIDDIEEYSNLTDGIVRTVEMSKDPKLAKGRELVRRIRKRNLYKMVDSVVIPKESPMDPSKINNETIFSTGREMDPQNFKAKDFILQDLRVHYGFGERNPLDMIHFYDGKKPSVKFRIQKEEVALIQPSCFEEFQLRLFAREKEKIDQLRKVWKVCLSNSRKKENNSNFEPQRKKRKKEEE